MTNQTTYLAALILLISLSLVPGCGQATSDSPAPVEVAPASYRDASPQQYLAAVFARYQNASSYRDRGVVKLGYQVDGRAVSQVAPVRVWLDHDQLYVEAYDVRLWSDAEAVTGWIVEPNTQNFDSQVLRRAPLRGRPTLEGLFDDPILRDRIAAGLAGPPPQLEWLLAREPMKPLFHTGHRFQFGPSESIDGRLCRSVLVHTPGAPYTFWIDEKLSLIRRVELPPLKAAAQPGQPSQTMSLSLELHGASFDTSAGGPEISPLPKTPKFVPRFVPLPPPAPAAILGSRLPVFRLQSVDGSFTLTDRGGDRDVTLLLRFSGDPVSIHSAATLDQWQRRLPESMRQGVRTALVLDPTQKSQLPAGIQLPVLVNREEVGTQSMQLEPGELLILDRRGAVAWKQSSVAPETLVHLGAIVADVLAGVDVPKRMRQQWSEQVDAYRRALSEQ